MPEGQNNAILNILEKAEFLEGVCTKMLSIIAQIEITNDKEEIIMLIESMQFLNNKVCQLENLSPKDTKAAIKAGRGDYKKIQQKCIQLGVV